MSLHVLHVMPAADRTYGGPVRSLLGYLQANESAGIRATVAAPVPSSSDREWLQARSQAADWHFFRSVGRGAYATSPGLLAWLVSAAARFDIVHVHGLLNPISSGAARLALFRSVPLVMRPFGTLSRYTFSYRRGALKKAYFRLVDRPNLERAAAVHFTTPGERSDAAWHGLDLDHRAHVVPPPFTGAQSARAVNQNRVVALFLSRLHPVKHVELLIDAWPRVLREMPEAALILAGSGAADYTGALERRVQALNLSRTVRFAGQVHGEAKRSLLAESGVFVLPSYHENFGMAALEAIAAGVPVVCTREVHLAPLIEQHALGRIAERSDTDLAAAIVSVLRDPLMQRRCAENGPRLIDDRFSSSAIGKQLAKMYRSVLESGHNR